MSTNGNGTHKTPVPAENSVADVLRKIEGLPEELQQLDALQLAALAVFTATESSEKAVEVAKQLRGMQTIQSVLAEKVAGLNGQMVTFVEATAADRAALHAEVASLRTDVDKHAEGILEAIGEAKTAKQKIREALASDIDLAETIERERAARLAEHERLTAIMEPIVAAASNSAANQAASKVGKKAGTSAALKTGGGLGLGYVALKVAESPTAFVRELVSLGWYGVAVLVIVIGACGLLAQRFAPKEESNESR